MSDSIVGIVDWILKMFLYYIIPFSITFTLIAQYFETLKPDKGSTEKEAVQFFKDALRIFAIGLIAWVAIYVVRTLLPAAGTSVVEGLGF